MATKNNAMVNIEPPKFEEVRFKIIGGDAVNDEPVFKQG